MENYIDKECLDCRHHRTGKCDTWCDSGEAWTPLNRSEYKKVVHGRWIGRVHMFDGNTYYYCSECGEESKDAYSWRGFQKYCPWCGAIMDKNE